MSDIDKETLQQKKKELEAELSSIQHELDDSLDRVRDEVSSSLSPSEHIRKHPLPAVGVAVLFGFLLGHDSDNPHDETDGSKTGKLTSTLGYEAKRLVTRKVFSILSDYIDDIL